MERGHSHSMMPARQSDWRKVTRWRVGWWDRESHAHCIITGSLLFDNVPERRAPGHSNTKGLFNHLLGPGVEALYKPPHVILLTAAPVN